jgi:hypothetical protein
MVAEKPKQSKHFMIQARYKKRKTLKSFTFCHLYYLQSYVLCKTYCQTISQGLKNLGEHQGLTLVPLIAVAANNKAMKQQN